MEAATASLDGISAVDFSNYAETFISSSFNKLKELHKELKRLEGRKDYEGKRQTLLAISDLVSSVSNTETSTSKGRQLKEIFQDYILIAPISARNSLMNDAMKGLIHRHKQLLNYFIRKYSNSRESEECEQQGIISLLHAVDTYNPLNPNMAVFGVHARWQVRRGVQPRVKSDVGPGRTIIDGSIKRLGDFDKTETKAASESSITIKLSVHDALQHLTKEEREAVERTLMNGEFDNNAARSMNMSIWIFRKTVLSAKTKLVTLLSDVK